MAHYKYNSEKIIRLLMLTMLILAIGCLIYEKNKYIDCSVIAGNEAITIKFTDDLQVDSIHAIHIDYNASGYYTGSQEVESASWEKDVSTAKQYWLIGSKMTSVSIEGWYPLGGTEAACPVTITLEVWKNNQKKIVLARDYIH